MRRHMNTLSAFFAATLFLCNQTFSANQSAFNSTDSYYSNAGVMYLRIVNSARAAGMGSCTVNLVDEESPLYNPGGLGLFHLHKNLGLSIPLNSEWLPELDNALRLKSYSVSGGHAFPIGADGDRPRVALAVSYSRVEFDYGIVNRGDEGEAFDDVADYYSAAIGVDYYARLGIGITRKYIKSIDALGEIGDEGRAEASDYGLLLELPVAELLSRGNAGTARNSKESGYEITPSFAYVVANDGENINYPYAIFSDPLPKHSRTGIALKVGTKRGENSVISALLAYEIEKDKTGTRDKFNRKGIELALYEAVFARLGNIDDDPGQIHAYTFGFGVSLRGVIYMLSTFDIIQQPTGVLNRCDLNFDYSRYEGGDYALANTQFLRLRLSI